MGDNQEGIKIIVCGAGGRMGGRIIHAIQKTQGMLLAGGVERAGHPISEEGIGQYLGIPGLTAPLSSELGQIIDRAHVVVDFTSPEAGLKNLSVARQHQKPLVVGTTGFTAEQKKEFKKAAEAIPVCLSPNMSVGVNLLFNMVGQVAKILGSEYDPEIIEIHHRAKKDAPSGTAMQLAHILADAKEWELEKTGVYGRHGLVGVRKTEEIGIHAVRTGDVVGEHTIIFGGPGERIEITHRAHSRDTFAYGAIKAATFIASAPPGLYDMQDVLGLRG